jgi:predicted membrane channel-forming protein YqfA (hemolysin III family)
MQVDAGPYRYQGLQVLLAVVLGFAHVALYLTLLVFHLFLFVMPLPTVLGIAIGTLEIALSSKLSAALAVLKFWLLAVGVITTVYSVGCLVYVRAILT